MALLQYSQVQNVRMQATKRVFDFILALLGLVMLSPLFGIFAFFIWREDGFPIFYSQERVGYRGKVFRLYKFRSMVNNAEAVSGPVFSSEKDPRITGIGRFMRSTAMDELPQLWNIFKGDMSFVGPRSERPCFVEEFKQQIPHYHLRHSVRPGLTGAAQVYGRYSTTARNKLRFDLITIKDQSLLYSLKLIGISFWITLRGKWTTEKR